MKKFSLSWCLGDQDQRPRRMGVCGGFPPSLCLGTLFISIHGGEMAYWEGSDIMRAPIPTLMWCNHLANLILSPSHQGFGLLRMYSGVALSQSMAGSAESESSREAGRHSTATAPVLGGAQPPLQSASPRPASPHGLDDVPPVLDSSGEKDQGHTRAHGTGRVVQSSLQNSICHRF